MISELANHLWQSSLFACVMGLLTLMLRRNRAAVRHGLWLAASVKFLVPFSLLIGLGGQVEWREGPVVAHPRLAQRAPSRVPAVLVSLWLCGFAANCLAWWRRWRQVRAAWRAASPLPLNLPIPALATSSYLEPGVVALFRTF